MKKIAFMFAAVAAMTFVACGGNKQEAATEVEVADTVAVDTVAADTVAADSVVADSTVAE